MKNSLRGVRRFLPLLALASTLFLSVSVRAADAGWVKLFDGKTLAGWEQHSGKALYRVEDGAICTTRTYGDFILDLEFKVAPDMNSGVQFRSEYYTKETETVINGTKKRKFPADRVFGYQYEIDPSPRAYTGGV